MTSTHKDWLRADDYKMADLPGYFWAWEFLRRNPTYRQDWDSVISRFDPIPGCPGSYRLHDPPWRSDPTTRAGADEISLTPGFSIADAGSERWHLSGGFRNPALDRPDLSFWLTHSGALFGQPSLTTRTLGSSVYYTRVDALLPWAVQQRALRAEYKQVRDRFASLMGQTAGNRGGTARKRDRTPRFSAERLTLMLRALDGRSAGAAPSTLAEVLLPGVENIYPERLASHRIDDLLRDAEAMLTDGYRTLLWAEIGP